MEIRIDDGFQFGLGVFETIALEQGRPVFLQEHLRRLQKAADFFGWGQIASWGITEEEILRWLDMQRKQAEEEQKAGQKDMDSEKETGTSIQGQLTHGGLKIMLSEKNRIFALRENHYHPAQYEQGFTMDFSKVRRNETSPLVTHKTMNYGDCILEKRAATKAGMDERIFLNTKGQIAEGCVSNIFFIRKGEICTPSIDCGLLPGIVRDYVLQTEKVTESYLYPEDLAGCEACFVTNSLMGIMPVRKLGVYEFSLSEKVRQLQRQYQQTIRKSETKNK